MKKIKVLVILFLIMSLTGCSFGGGSSVKAKKVELEVWGVFDAEGAYQEIIDAYQISRPNIKVVYKKFRWQEYEKELVNAWAEGRGPDVFLIHNDWVRKYENKIYPFPGELEIPILRVERGKAFQKDKVVTEVKKTSYSLNNLKKDFVNAVYQDVIYQDQIWGLPLAVDTLGLYYNRKMLDGAGVLEPPRTWQGIIDATKSITRQDSEGNIILSAIAMGTSDNIQRSSDILSLIMMQNDTTMVNSDGQVSMSEKRSSDKTYYPGVDALRFYTDFSSPLKETYTWSEDMPEAVDAFIQGKVAMIFDYAFRFPFLKAQAPSLDIGISTIPHINFLNNQGVDFSDVPNTNVADYWLMTTAKVSENPDEAWDFIVYATTSKYKDVDGKVRYQAGKYIDSTRKPPALRGLIGEYMKDEEMEPFVSHAATAENWYHGRDPEHAKEVLREAIDKVYEGELTTKDAIKYAEKNIESTY